MTVLRRTDQVRALYDERARTWKWMAIPDRILGMTRLRRRHFSGVTGAVLDVGCGTGENFRFLAGADSVAAVDISPEMVTRAEERARSLGLGSGWLTPPPCHILTTPSMSWSPPSPRAPSLTM